MLEAYFRNHYQKWFVDSLALFISRFASPNLVTVYGAMFGLITAISLGFGHTSIAIIALIISGYLDSLDGTIARLTSQTSAFGSALDILCDRIVEFAVIFGLYLVDPIGRATAVIWMLGSVLICICSFLVVGIFTANYGNKGFYYSPGIMERFEAFMFFIAMILFPNHFNLLAYIFTVLVTITAILRTLEFFYQSTIHGI